MTNKTIKKVQSMPNIPSRYNMKNWQDTAVKYDSLVFDFEAKGDFLPFIWWDRTHINVKRDTFGIPSYVGSIKQCGGSDHEAITCITSVLGATVAGIDKSNQNGHNWVLMCENYFNSDNLENLFLNSTVSESGHTFWYEVYANLLASALLYFYPNTGGMEEKSKVAADKWYEACYHLGGKENKADFDHTAFDFKGLKPVDNGKWREPEAAAGIGWLMYMAYMKWKDKKYLQAAKWCMDFLERTEKNPFYELLLPYGAYIAARLNAEIGTNYDVEKLLNWCFDGNSECRPGWGVVSEKWGAYDCHGLCGSLTDWGQRWDSPDDGTFKDYKEELSGYAFAANTFSMAAPFIPLVRYDSSFAHDIGKWMLNAANNARLFYPDALPLDHQSCGFWRGDPNHAIAYEGLRKKWDTKSPYATGDAIRYSWGAIDLGLYGSAHSGIFGGIIKSTNVEGILQLDCLRTDYYHNKAYPTFLYYNPFPEVKTIEIYVGEAWVDLYDGVSHKFLKSKVNGNTAFEILGDTAVLLVLIPNNKEKQVKEGKLLAGDIVLDYQYPFNE